MAVPGPGQSRHASPTAAGGGSPSGGVESLDQLHFVGAGISLFAGNGAPKLVRGITGADAPVVGDLYLNATGGVGSLIYRCTVAGANPTWVVVL